MKVLLEGGVGLLGAGDVAGLEVLSQLAEEGGDGVLLGGRTRGTAAVVMVVVGLVGALLLADLLRVLLDGRDV